MMDPVPPTFVRRTRPLRLSDTMSSKSIRKHSLQTTSYGTLLSFIFCSIVASTSNQSGTGGTVVFTNARNLTADTEFGKP
jgi:hypothetical protein